LRPARRGCAGPGTTPATPAPAPRARRPARSVPSPGSGDPPGRTPRPRPPAGPSATTGPPSDRWCRGRARAPPGPSALRGCSDHVTHEVQCVPGQILAVTPQVAPHPEAVAPRVVHHRRGEALERDRPGVVRLAQRPEECLEVDRAGAQV